MGRYRLRYFTDLAGRIYMAYRDEIWYGFNRSEEIPLGTRRSWKYVYIPAPVAESLDLFALIWLATYKNSILWKPFNEAKEVAETSFDKQVKLRSGEYDLLKRLATLAGTNHFSLILSAERVLADAEKLQFSKKRVAWLPPALRELSSRSKVHPLCYVFAKSALFYMRGRK
ncbi:hypothetical protein Igag_1972 [Ignisphaera aggregans DSM 17230]|uniref:Uncharacterized protein n=1 Tax=Ignisphaera aggregans (strain DSM 17230 / JCM 13409 / AQ1.S1) TaxID=583356 RepID=E0STH8_IGNAA|nr:hypothetical protein Igag_1972 [Ignisphaera aggregans DSM 17230]